jgi:hypothetical protein
MLLFYEILSFKKYLQNYNTCFSNNTLSHFEIKKWKDIRPTHVMYVIVNKHFTCHVKFTKKNVL